MTARSEDTGPPISAHDFSDLIVQLIGLAVRAQQAPLGEDGVKCLAALKNEIDRRVEEGSLVAEEPDED